MPSTPGQFNTFTPNEDATDNLVIDFSRNPSKFALPNYVLYVPVKKNIGIWTEMTVEMAGRLLDSEGRDLEWADGADAPTHHGELEEFDKKAFRCRRFAPGFRMGEDAADQATWDVVAQHNRIAAQRCMTLRTQRCATKATNTANYPAGHSSAVTSISGVTGRWDESTTARNDIKRSFDHAANQIVLATLAAVTPEDLMVVVNPNTARKMALSQELRDMVKHSPAAEKTITKGLGPRNRFGLPEQVHDYQVHIEDAVKVTSRKGASASKSYVWPDGVALMCSRPGELEGVEGAPTFSTLSLFLKEEMTVETKHDRDNRNHKGRIVDYYEFEITAPISGYVFTASVN